VRGCRGVLSEDSPGAAPCQTQFQSGLTDPLQGTADSLSPDGGSLGKIYLKKGKMLREREEGGKKL